jgi:hypothetical protein
MEGRQRRSFTDDYKRQAVDLVASSGRSIGSVVDALEKMAGGAAGILWITHWLCFAKDRPS